VLPTSFTLGSRFFGVFAIGAASRGEFSRAVTCIVFGGVCDALDGRVARATKSGSEFGEQLDSLVDAITFGLAPAMIVYFSALNPQGWSWLLAFFYTACAVSRLARFNVTQAGASKAYFIGMPSPAAGGTLATYYWFSETALYKNTVIGQWPWHELIWYLIVGLGILMVSPVPYPAWPRIGIRTWSARIGLVIVLSILIGVTFFPKEFLFSFGVGYAFYGLVRVAILGLWERRQTHDVTAHYEAYASEFVDEDEVAADDADDGVDDAPLTPVREITRPRDLPRDPQRDALREAQREARRDASRQNQPPTVVPIGLADDDGAAGSDLSARPRRKRRRRPRTDGQSGPDITPPPGEPAE
jgi:CDP-diacylglycerol--serine O-phosphatidyltransferase